MTRPEIRLHLLGLSLPFLLVPCLAGADEKEPPWPPSYTHEDLKSLPEPLFFDLFRRPDSHAGEVEVNTLVGVSLKREARVEWAPEIEYTFAAGHAIEMQVNVDHDQLRRVQVGLQGTLGWSRNLRFIHAWQLVSAYEAEERAVSGTGLYLFAVRLTPRLSSWVFVGGRVLSPSGGGPEAALIVNPSLYWRLHRKVNLGLEGGILHGPQEQIYLALAEVEWDVTSSVQVHVGVGPRWKEGQPQAFLALRVGWDRD